jgi:5-hydroxyisourate hydrolase-like protein (transthyretin family)
LFCWPSRRPALAAGGQITGTVTDAVSHAPIENVEVDAYDSGGNFVASMCTAADGSYTLGGLATGSYSVDFTAGSFSPACAASPNYLPQSYNDPVAVTAGSTTSGIDAALAAGGQITGTVTGATTNQPLAGIEVDLFDSSGTIKLSTTCTEDDGTYTFSGLATGSYDLDFVLERESPCGPSGPASSDPALRTGSRRQPVTVAALIEISLVP